ncbi:MAG: hypothetical protein JOZ75_15045 [Candidatus Dormibacteraeota bacterium]|nr:hypothetical protein [Candidatus Dormibacteraeota bacterium]
MTGDYRDQYGQGSSRFPPPPPPGNLPAGYPEEQNPAQGYGQQGSRESGYQQQPGYRGPDSVRRGDSRTASPRSRGRSLLWVALAIVNVILVLDFIFLLAGANDVGFGHIVYGVGSALNAPFRNLFNITVTRHGHPVQWADLIAIVIYTVAAVIIDRLIVIFTTPSSRPSTSPPYQGSPPRY